VFGKVHWNAVFCLAAVFCITLLAVSHVLAQRFETQAVRGGFVRSDRLTGQVLVCTFGGQCRQVLPSDWVAVSDLPAADYFKGLE
jgi:hypothetical protein